MVHQPAKGTPRAAARLPLPSTVESCARPGQLPWSPGLGGLGRPRRQPGWSEVPFGMERARPPAPRRPACRERQPAPVPGRRRVSSVGDSRHRSPARVPGDPYSFPGWLLRSMGWLRGGTGAVRLYTQGLTRSSAHGSRAPRNAAGSDVTGSPYRQAARPVRPTASDRTIPVLPRIRSSRRTAVEH